MARFIFIALLLLGAGWLLFSESAPPDGRTALLFVICVPAAAKLIHLLSARLFAAADPLDRRQSPAESEIRL